MLFTTLVLLEQVVVVVDLLNMPLTQQLLVINLHRILEYLDGLIMVILLMAKLFTLQDLHQLEILNSMVLVVPVLVV